MLSVKGLKLLKNTHYKTVRTHTNLIKTFSSFSPPVFLHPVLIPPRSIPVFLSLYYPSAAQTLGPGPALPRCKVEMLMLIKSFIWFRLISVALLLSRAVANQIRAERRGRGGQMDRKEALFEVQPRSVC